MMGYARYLRDMSLGELLNEKEHLQALPQIPIVVRKIALIEQEICYNR